MKFGVASAASAAFAVAAASVSAQVMVGQVRVNGADVPQQRITLSCPFFDTDTGWEKENTVWTLHLVDLKKVSGAAPLDVHGRYSFSSNKWWKVDSIDENRIVLGHWDSEWIREYVVTGRTRRGDFVTKGDRVPGERLACATISNYIDRNTLEIKWEVDQSLNETVVEGGQMKKCDGVDAWPRNKTVVSGQCQIVPYRAPPNRIGF